MGTSFGDAIKRLRENNHLLQRQVASELQIDTPLLSKIERGERRAKKEQVLLFAKLYKASKEELLTLWLAELIMDTIEGEEQAQRAIELVTKKLKIQNNRNK